LRLCLPRILARTLLRILTRLLGLRKSKRTDSQRRRYRRHGESTKLHGNSFGDRPYGDYTLAHQTSQLDAALAGSGYPFLELNHELRKNGNRRRNIIQVVIST